MILRTDVEMLRQGTVQPAAVIHLSAIGVFDEQRNPAYAKALMEFIVSELKIPDTRSVRGRVGVKYSLSSTQVHQVLTHHPCTSTSTMHTFAPSTSSTNTSSTSTSTITIHGAPQYMWQF